MSVAPVISGNLLPAGAPSALAAHQPAEKTSFVNVVEKLLGDANAGQLQVDQSVRDLATGQAENVHDVILAVAKADLAFRTVLEVRNRLTDAYQEVMRMQV